MPNSFFQFKKFIIHQEHCAMKVTTDGCLFGAWVARQIMIAKKPGGLVLDIGTGTGLLSLMIAQQNEVAVDMIEINEAACREAADNAAASPWGKNLRVHHSDIRTHRCDQLYDFIVSNPPFYSDDLRSEQVERNLALHSEELTLGQLIKSIKKFLSKDGLFFLLFPYKRWRELKLELEKEKLSIDQVVFAHPFENADPFRVMIKGSFGNKTDVSVQEINIHDKERKYSPLFIDLLKEYYLYL